jgi:hypothetical protein
MHMCPHMRRYLRHGSDPPPKRPLKYVRHVRFSARWGSGAAQTLRRMSSYGWGCWWWRVTNNQLGISVVCLGIHRYIALPHRLHNFGFLACVSLLMYLKVSISARAARPPAYQEFGNTCLVRGCDQWEHGGYGVFLDGVGKSTVVTHPSR